MYVIGNTDTYGETPMWKQVIEMLRNGLNLGPKLPLCCPRHPDTAIEVATVDDFVRLSPEGGCALPCKLRLECGHSCTYKCHSRVRHDASICQEPCPKRRDSCQHICPLVCGIPCHAKCQAKVNNVSLPCGHRKTSAKCYEAQDTSNIICTKHVEKVVPGCGHTALVMCGESTLSTEFRCLTKCGYLLACGHPCENPCDSCRSKREDGQFTIEHDQCKAKCGRPYTTCKHVCRDACHGDRPCSNCTQKCQISCHHSRCGKECQEPCAPCAEICLAGCRHEGLCQLPCAVPCTILPCSKRCESLLSCGHQCPSICGEDCPSSKFCQLCAKPELLDTMVDFVDCSKYRDANLDEDPIIVPPCGHIISRSSLDGHMAISKFYLVDTGGALRSIHGVSAPFSVRDLKACPTCRHSLRSIHRYNRIVKRGLIDEATKRFIVWANTIFVPLEALLHKQESVLATTKARLHSQPNRPLEGDPPALDPAQIVLHKSRSSQLQISTQLIGLRPRYVDALHVRKQIVSFYHKVSEAEQPFGKVFRMVQDVKRSSGAAIEFPVEGNILRVRERLLATALLLRCDLMLLSDFVRAYQDVSSVGGSQFRWPRGTLKMDLSQNREDCLNLATAAANQEQPMQEIEARLYFAKHVAVERTSSLLDLGEAHSLIVKGKEQVALAKALCTKSANTRTMLKDVENVERELRESTFYTSVSNDEKRAIYQAMATDFRGTGHWYYCTNQHLV